MNYFTVFWTFPFVCVQTTRPDLCMKKKIYVTYGWSAGLIPDQCIQQLLWLHFQQLGGSHWRFAWKYLVWHHVAYNKLDRWSMGITKSNRPNSTEQVLSSNSAEVVYGRRGSDSVLMVPFSKSNMLICFISPDKQSHSKETSWLKIRRRKIFSCFQSVTSFMLLWVFHLN